MAGCPGHSNIKIDLCRDFVRDYENIQQTIVVKILEEPNCCPTCGKPLDK